MTREDTELNALLQCATRGRGGAKMICKETLLALYRLAAEKELIVDGIEPFKIEGRLEIPYVHLTLNSSELHQSMSSLCWADRIVEMEEIIDSMLNETEKAGGEFRFNAWVSKREDWLPPERN